MSKIWTRISMVCSIALIIIVLMGVSVRADELQQEAEIITETDESGESNDDTVLEPTDPDADAAIVGSGDDYPAYLKNAAKDALVDPWNFYNRECTSFVAWCLNSRNNVKFTNQYLGASRWGNAKTWGTVASSLGVRVDKNPAAGSVAWWTYGEYGHVAWVSSVNGNNVSIEEYNWATTGGYGTRTIAASNPAGYIHIADLNPSPTVSFTPWNNSNYTYIRDTDASKGMEINVSGGTCTSTGMYLYDSNGTYLAKGSNPSYTLAKVYFKINEELGYTLKSGTTYKYKFYAVVNGQNYWSNEYSFKTTGPTDIADLTATLAQTSYTYDGQAKKPSVTVKDGSTNLVSGTDFTVAYSNNTNAGTATVTVTGKGNYKGTKKLTFTINKANPTLKFANSSVAKKTTDSAFTNTLTKTTDGTVSFKSSNTGVATVNSSGSVTIKGVGKTTITATASEGTNYKKGSASYELTVTDGRVDVSGLTVALSSSSYTYDGNAKKPTVTVKNGSKTLVSGTDYTVSYSNNTNAGTAKVTVTGKGNYKGTATATFTIAKAAPVLTFASSSLTKTLGDSAFTNKLTSTTDGTVTFKSDNTKVAAVNETNGTVTIKGTGTANITASATAGTNYKAGSVQYKLTVKDGGPIRSISIAEKNITMVYGKERTLPTVTYTPSNTTDEKKVNWNSSDASVAKAESGKIKALKPGSAVLTASVPNRSAKATVNVRVLFKDVTDAGSWYYEPVYWALDNKVTSGLGTGTFQPATELSRAQAVMFLYKQAGQPNVSKLPAVNFKDVPSDAWYYNAVRWAVAKNITTGLGTGTFQPETTCTRAMIVTFLMRYSKMAGTYVAPSSSAGFKDVPGNAWYKQAVDWAVANGVTTGMGTGTFQPNVTCNRAMMVTFLKRTSELLK